jgi:hypothetical protein
MCRASNQLARSVAELQRMPHPLLTTLDLTAALSGLILSQTQFRRRKVGSMRYCAKEVKPSRDIQKTSSEEVSFEADHHPLKRFGRLRCWVVDELLEQTRKCEVRTRSGLTLTESRVQALHSTLGRFVKETVLQ